ncbi:MAG: DUF523 domain-containing protein [Clostridia bacterium]|nr:DUF523 domain-containing protein [Clostridia bacterium]
MKEKLLISACLLGRACRYDGRSVPAVDYEALSEKYELIPVCPEVDGGLPTPRTPSERVGERVLMRDGRDVTENYMRGAMHAYEECLKHGCRVALLKERSPSCGNGKIYDGSFSGTLTERDGVTAEYLKARGISVFGESEIKILLDNAK